ncbi:hypothetical protein [Corynebacterium aquilae]|uniref:Uncharacterized protein n=1 Tax=Corynebacterium aquilae DSM 44791 TaxID=1431546 RepID=A0A1L7CIN6_9CORY|nr:hypothetical protein [Corynebacterium aquilae]APT85643.1 hypothetical protein CAQU_11995 [Corynebacterium aquilae DSM 44791]
MMKNRIRTAAIAGAVALATSLSGVAVPAFAAENTGNHMNKPDNSAPAAGTVKSEAELRAAEDAISTWLIAKHDYRDQIQNKYQTAFAFKTTNGALNVDEQSTVEAFEAVKKEISAQLAQAGKNADDARASVAAALADDEKARVASGALEGQVRDVHNKNLYINNLIAAVNKANKTGLGDIPYLWLDKTHTTSAATAANVADVLRAINIHLANVDHYGNVDNDDKHFVARDYAAALETLKNDKAVKELTAVMGAGNDAILQAEKHDVIVLQAALARANAQVQTLRILEAVYGTTATFVDLYENDALYADYQEGWTTLRPKYKDVMLGLRALLPGAINDLKAADKIFNDSYEGFEVDLKNSTDWKKDQELRTYYTERGVLAIQNYNDIVNNADWQMAVEKLQLLKAQFGKDAQAEQAKAAEEAKKAEADAKAETNRLLAEIAANKNAAAAVNDTKVEAPVDNKKPADDNKKPGSSDNKGDKKFDMKTVGIFAVIAAIIAAIAAAFPHLQHLLPKA